MIARTTVKFAMSAMTVATLGACAMGVRGAGGGQVVGVSFMVAEPPRERVEVVTVAPSQEHVWIKGHYIREGNEYAWREGHWERPAAGYRTWVVGHWEHERRGWYYVDGHWAA